MLGSTGRSREAKSPRGALGLGESPVLEHTYGKTRGLLLKDMHLKLGPKQLRKEYKAKFPFGDSLDEAEDLGSYLSQVL